MSTLKEEVEVIAKENLAKNLKVEINAVGTTTLDGEKLVITYPENVYLENAEANGVSENEIKRVQKFHSEFIKGIVKDTKDQLVNGYEKHKDATGFTMDLETTLGKVSLFGDKHVTHTVKGTEYAGTGITLKHKYTLPGVKASIQASKSAVFNSFK